MRLLRLNTEASSRSPERLIVRLLDDCETTDDDDEAAAVVCLLRGLGMVDRELENRRVRGWSSSVFMPLASQPFDLLRTVMFKHSEAQRIAFNAGRDGCLMLVNGVSLFSRVCSVHAKQFQPSQCQMSEPRIYMRNG